MEEVLASLPFSEEITGALLRGEGRRGRILDTVLRYEQGHFPDGGEGDPIELAEAYLTALRWADDAGRWLVLMPLRIKLTLAFTGVMAVLLAAAGIALSVLVAQNLDSTIDDGLAGPRARRRGGRARPAGQHRRAVRAGAHAGRPRASRRRPARAPAPLLSAGAARARPARRRDRRARRAAAARPAGAARRAACSWSASRSRQRERALDSLHALLAIGGPLALLIASAVGYALAAAALRPVERMRRHAAEVTAARDERAAARCRRPTTRSAGSGARSTRCWPGSRWRSSASGRSSPTPRTSCARRSRSCARSSSSRCAASTRARSSRPRCARPPRRPSGCRGSPRTCS